VGKLTIPRLYQRCWLLDDSFKVSTQYARMTYIQTDGHDLTAHNMTVCPLRTCYAAKMKQSKTRNVDQCTTRWPPFLSFFLAKSQPPQIGCLPYFHTWCGLSANLRCKSETCCTQLAENTGRKIVAKNRHLGTIAQLCRAISSQLRHVSTTGKTC